MHESIIEEMAFFFKAKGVYFLGKIELPEIKAVEKKESFETPKLFGEALRESNILTCKKE